MKIYNNISELIGKTPLLRVNNYSKKRNLRSDLLVKLEYFNPAGSVKDRAALEMITAAEQKGLLKPNSVIIESTSGNTGIGLAAVGISKGYRVILTMPETMSVERRNLLAAYGAEIVLTEGAKGMAGAVEKAEELAKTVKNSFIPSQFTNPDNYMAHIKTTGPEIFEDTEGKIDIFVAGVGTGGTITGVATYLKQQNPNIKIVAVEPEASPLLSKGFAGAHGLQGIGANFVPEILNLKLIDQIITVSDSDAYKTAKALSQEEGILVGITSGAALFAATKLSENPENFCKTVVALLPDTGERYMSTPLFK